MKKRITTVRLGMCSSCNVQAEMGTARIGQEYIHEFCSIPKKCGGEYTHFMYCGYGSVLDGLYLFVKLEPTYCINNALLCNKCLVKILGGSEFVCFQYMFHGNAEWKRLHLGKRGSVKFTELTSKERNGLPKKFFKKAY